METKTIRFWGFEDDPQFSWADVLLFRPPLSPQDCELCPRSGTHTPHFLHRCSCFLSETGCWVLDSSEFCELRPMWCQESWNYATRLWNSTHCVLKSLNHSSSFVFSDGCEMNSELWFTPLKNWHLDNMTKEKWWRSRGMHLWSLKDRKSDFSSVEYWISTGPFVQIKVCVSLGRPLLSLPGEGQRVRKEVGGRN